MNAAILFPSLLLVLSLGSPVHADDLQSLPDGVALTVGSDQVELRVASPHAFRLHILASGASSPAPSIFLSGQPQPATPFTVLNEGDIVGIKTAFGELRVNRAKKLWSWRDAQSAGADNWAPWQIAPANETGAPTVSTLSLKPVSTAPPLFYGSGDHPHLGPLVQTEGPSEMGNGWTALPQYWSTQGYGALMISQDDNHPASWRTGSGGEVEWSVPGSSIDLYLAPAPNLPDWLRDQAELTGFAPVPPRWALGYLQSRWGWKDKTYIDETLARFRHDRLPVDTFIFDFEWYTKSPDYGVPAAGKPDFVDFDWNPVLFPDPPAQLAGFARAGLRMVGIRKPRLGNSANLAMARAKGWIMPSDSKEPTEQRNLNFANPDLRAWYESNLRKFDDIGVAGFWNDEGELAYSEYSYWNLAEAELLQQAKPGARFWSINRSFAPGMQRLGAATWSGDIGSDWSTLARTPGELLAYGLSGMPYAGCDIGGFSGTPTPELLVRWMEAGVFFPVMRSHSELNQTPRFPWLYGPEAENAIRVALDLRYRLLPYYDSLAHETYRTAMPLMRPLVVEFPHDPHVANETDEWLMGPGLLVAPVLQPGGKRDVYLPDAPWFAFGSSRNIAGPATLSVSAKLAQIPLYVRAGTILPLGPVLQHTGEASRAPLELQIYPGGDASFDFVEDDGETLKYQGGALRVTHFRWDDQARRLSWKTEGASAGAGRFRALKLVLFQHHARRKNITFRDAGSMNFD